MTDNEESGGAAPVLVVGAGPVGLTTAILLATRGVRTLVVERRPGTAIHPRARGISGAAMRIVAGAGVAVETDDVLRRHPAPRSLPRTWSRRWPPPIRWPGTRGTACRWSRRSPN